MNNSDMPAMPSKVSVNRDSGDVQPYQFGNDDFSTLGLTKREYFVAQAMKGILANGAMVDQNSDEGKWVAGYAIQCADASLAALEQEQAK